MAHRPIGLPLLHRVGRSLHPCAHGEAFRGERIDVDHAINILLMKDFSDVTVHVIAEIILPFCEVVSSGVVGDLLGHKLSKHTGLNYATVSVVHVVEANRIGHDQC